MLEHLLLTVGLLRATLRGRGDLLAENLLLRQQLAVLTRRTRKPPRLRAFDTAFWLVACLVRGGPGDWASSRCSRPSGPRGRRRLSNDASAHSAGNVVIT